MTLRNLRAYTQNKDDTLSTVTPSDYETGKGANARLRKINLNVDIATQAELNEAFNLLSNAIEDISTGTLSNYYTKPEVNDISTALSTALTGEIDAEATARKEADNAIKASLSAYALSTTVADAYKVKVSDADEQTSSFVYTITQGELTAGTINVPKDMFVEGASFQGTVLVLSVRGQDTPISTDLSGLVDVYTGGSTTDAVVSVDKDTNVITVTATDAIARVGTSEDLSNVNTIYGAKAYADAIVADKNVTASGDAIVSANAENNAVTVGATTDLCAAVVAANAALQTISHGTDGTYVTTNVGTKADNDQTVAVELTFGELSAGTTGVAKAEEAKAYVDAAISGVDGKFVKGLNSQTTAYVDITGDTSLTGNKIVTVNASEKVTGAVDKVELCASIWDTVTNKADLTALEAEATTRENADKFLSGKIDALSSSLNAAEGDDYISAYVDGNTVKVEALCATVWNEVSAKIDTNKVVAAANELSVLALSALSDYNDIDEIISEVEKIKGALVNFTRALEA